MISLPRQFVLAGSIASSFLPQEAGTEKGSPFVDAVAVWHMAEGVGGAGDQGRLAVRGSVELGVELAGSERDASQKRGGDGRVATFAGGYLVAGEDRAEPLTLSGDEMTFSIRLRDSAGKWDVPLFSRLAPDDPYGAVLHGATLNHDLIGWPEARRIDHGGGLEYLWRTTPLRDRVRPEYFEQGDPPNLLRFHTDWEAKHAPERRGDFLAGVLRLQAPVELIGPARWHDVVVRFRRAKLDLFVDGVLLDEEWPHGELHRFQGPFLIGAGFTKGELLSGFHGQIDHVALWDRALGDEEIALLCGGAEEAQRRDREILGPNRSVGQYWRPRGYNTSVGDCMAFAHDGRLHVFFLSNRRYGGSKWGLIASPWGHISTRDLVHWEEHPCPLDITEPWECCLGTGSFVVREGRFYLFYIKHDRRAWFLDNPNFGDAVFEATSDDGIHFEKQSAPLLVPGFFNENDINADVYPDETNGGYIMSLSNWKVLESKDLRDWRPRAQLTTPQWWPCTSYWKWNDWYYFTSCGQQWQARQPIEQAPTWESPAYPTLNDGIRVSQVAAFAGRHLMVGFTPEPPGAYYGGELLVRELIQHPDGTLGTRWPQELIPLSGAPMDVEFEATAGDATWNGDAIHLRAGEGPAIGALVNVPQDVRITLRVVPKKGSGRFGLCVRAQGDREAGCELQFLPAAQQARFAPASAGEEAPHWMAISGVTGLDAAFTLDLIVKDDLIDACIDERRTIITRNRTGLTGDKLMFFVDAGEVTFENVRVRALHTSPSTTAR